MRIKIVGRATVIKWGLLFMSGMAATPAYARLLPSNSLTCKKESSILQAIHDGSAESGDPEAVRKDCSFSATPLNVKRLSCNGFVCQIKIINYYHDDSINELAYTLRRYQP